MTNLSTSFFATAACLALSTLSCKTKDPNREKMIPDQVTKKNEMPAEKDFNSILEQNALPPVYFQDDALLSKQMMYPGTVSVTEAFSRGLQSLFVHSENCNGRDDFYSMVKTSPESFQLNEKATDEDVKNAILGQMASDKGLKIYLLPENSETEAPPGVNLFPPEYGETVKDFWIWYIHCNFFPGPVWILVKRDGSINAYHYGYM